MDEDYYSILGVQRDAAQADIQKAYRTLARKYHPDLNPDDKTAKEKFQRVQKAFDVLNDTSKRELYDRYGSSFEQMGAGGGGGPGGPGGAGGPRGGYTWTSGPGGGDFEFDLGSIFGDRFRGEGAQGGFEDLFRNVHRGGEGGGRKARRTRGPDIEQAISIPFSIAVEGGQIDLALQGRDQTISVRIPPGIDEGQKIRLKEQGMPGPKNGPPGDLFITVHIEDHPHFQRRGNDLLVRLPVTVGEAAEGAKVDVPTPRGTVSLRVPPGTSSGAKLRVKGQGVQPAKGAAGDLLVEVQIVLPKNLDAESVAALKQIDARHPLTPREHLRW